MLLNLIGNRTDASEPLTQESSAPVLGVRVLPVGQDPAEPDAVATPLRSAGQRRSP
jgi:hypothetical protein